MSRSPHRDAFLPVVGESDDPRGHHIISPGALAKMHVDMPSTILNWVPTLSRLSGFVWSSKIAVAAGGLPEIGIYFNGGLGDDIMCSAVARELKKRGTR